RSGPFAEELRRAREQEAAGFKLSAHARERIEQRGISLNASEQRSLNEAIQQLEEKGSKDALLLRSDAAFVVNVPS
ncbi:MAG: flagellar biosynthesis protein, partial [Rhodothermales bacterium]